MRSYLDLCIVWQYNLLERAENGQQLAVILADVLYELFNTTAEVRFLECTTSGKATLALFCRK